MERYMACNIVTINVDDWMLRVGCLLQHTLAQIVRYRLNEGRKVIFFVCFGSKIVFIKALMACSFTHESEESECRIFSHLLVLK